MKTSTNSIQFERCLNTLFFMVFSLLLFPDGSFAQDSPVSIEDYKRAEHYLSKNVGKRIFKLRVTPNWIAGNDRFWYRNDTATGKEFILVDPVANTRQPAFNHVRFAQALSKVADTTFSARKLPFKTIKYGEDNQKLLFQFEQANWSCDLQSYKLRKIDEVKIQASNALVSPDGKWELFVKDYNLFVRSKSSQKERQLTTDGQRYYDYAGRPDSRTSAVTDKLAGIQYPPVAIWSPDSKKIITHRLDQRKVKELHLIQSVPANGSKRPMLHTYKYPFPGDAHIPLSELVIIDIAEQKIIRVKSPPLATHAFTPFFYQRIWWDENGEKFYFLDVDRGYLNSELKLADAQTGEVKSLLHESDTTPVQANLNIFERPNIRILDGGKEIIWFSERSGWGHLYLYDGKTGKLKHQITSGAWVVRDIIRIDDVGRWLYFTGAGREPARDPYYQYLYRIKLDGSRLELLTPENAHHAVTFSPTGNYFIDTYSRVNLPPVSVLRTADGRLVRKLETADISNLLESGWKYPQPFRVKARDDSTDIYGVIYFPSNFDDQKKYPVIESIYPGPQVIRTQKDFSPMGYGECQALAELGFIVVTIDGMGTPFRSRAFHDVSYGNLGEAGGLQDHVSGFRQLAIERPYMDLSRVGIYGHSGGGYASTRAILAYPDFYKVAVSSAGNHDQRGYLATWGERYQGFPNGANYEGQDNASLAKNLQGKLLLAFGDMDDNVHPALTIQVIDALIKANKDFDLILLPNANHSFRRPSRSPYFTRRLWDYFVRHLKGVEPPAGFAIQN